MVGRVSGDWRWRVGYLCVSDCERIMTTAGAIVIIESPEKSSRHSSRCAQHETRVHTVIYIRTAVFSALLTRSVYCCRPTEYGLVILEKMTTVMKLCSAVFCMPVELSWSA